MDQLTNQTVFDRNWQHFVVGKGEPSTVRIEVDPHETWPDTVVREACSYRACAIGICLPEGFDNTTIEFEPIGIILSEHSDLELHFSRCDGDFLYAVQRCHDRATEPNEDPDAGPDFGVLVDRHHSPTGATIYEAAGLTFHDRVEANLRLVAEAFGLTVPA